MSTPGVTNLPTLPSGAYPLTRGQGMWAAMLVGFVGLALTVFIPIAARTGSILAVPPDAIRFGAASLVPPNPDSPRAQGWRVHSASADSITLVKGEVKVTATAGVTTGDLSEQFQEVVSDYPREGMSGGGAEPRVLGPTRFRSASTGTDGFIAWVEGERNSATLALIPMYPGTEEGAGTRYVQIVARGPTQAMARDSKQIDAILDSVRFTLGDPR